MPRNRSTAGGHCHNVGAENVHARVWLGGQPATPEYPKAPAALRTFGLRITYVGECAS